MKSAYSYKRFSKLEQSKGDSLRRQSKEALNAIQWCNEHGYVLSDREFLDAGKSGYKGENIKEGGALFEFLKLVASGEIKKGSCLIIDDYSRFSRLQPLDNMALFLRVVQAGIGLAFLGNYDKRVIDRDLLNKEPNVLEWISREITRSYGESSEKARKIRAAQADKLSRMESGQILKHNCAPKYYSFNDSKKRYEQNDLTPIVTRIINDFLSGKSLYQISNQLNKEKIRSLRYANVQSNWTRMAIKSLLENKCLFGEFLGIPKYFSEPVITKDKWDKIQVLLKRNSENQGRYATDYVNIFRGIGWCASCNRAMATGVQKTNYKTGNLKAKPYRFLRCSSRSNAFPCKHNGNFNLADVEQSFFGEFLCQNPTNLLNADDKKEVKSIDADISEKQTKLNLVSAKIADLGELLGVVSVDDLKKKGKQLNDEKESLNAEIDELNLRRSSILAAPVSRDVLMSITEFNGNADGTDKVEKVYDTHSVAEIEKNLQDNDTRIKIRTHLPNLISKVVFDSEHQSYAVFNRQGKEVFQKFLNDGEVTAKVIEFINSTEGKKKTAKMSRKEVGQYWKQLESKFRDEIQSKRKKHGKKK